MILLRKYQFSSRVWITLLAVVIAAGLRLYAAAHIPLETDEDNYISAAVDFARAQSIREISDVMRNFEHPPLVKYLYSRLLVRSELESLPQELPPDFMESLPHSLDRARALSVIFGIGAVLALCLINPLAGLFMAVGSMPVYYSSIAYLDAPPVFFITLMALFFGKTSERRTGLYFWLSAACFGAAVAGKYPYALVGFILIPHALVTRRYNLRQVIAWGVVAVMVFYTLNPFIWFDPVGRLHMQTGFHSEYASGRHYNLLKPWIQMFYPHPEITYADEGLILPPLLDTLTFLLAFPGGWLLLRQQSLYGWWLLVAMIFQMFWKAQWLHHNLIFIVPYCISAVVMVKFLYQRFRSDDAPYRV